MTNKEFRSELETVVIQLRRIPLLSEICKLHLGCYTNDDDLNDMKRASFTIQDDIVEHDSMLYLDLLIDCYFMGFDLLESTLGFQDCRREMRRWLASASRTQIKLRSFGEWLKSATLALLASVSDQNKGKIIPYCDVKKLVCASRDFSWFISPLLPSWKNWCEHEDQGSFALVYQWLEYIQRMTVKSLDLVPEMMQEYKDDENRFKHLCYSHDDISALRDILYEWFPLNRVQNNLHYFRPKHGGGATSTFHRASVLTKYNLMSVDSRLFRTGDLDIDLTRYLLSDEVVGHREYTRVSEIVAVPKSMLKNRIISKEPTALMYFQQGWRHVLYETLREKACPLSKHVNLEHAELSASLAQRGSVMGDFATIDLSAASDSVTKQLVSRIFPPWIRNILFSCRSDYTQLPDGTKLLLEKFAPMGSNLCFPVETIVFSAICELAVRRSGWHKSEYLVYGDDIVIEAEIAPLAKVLLESMHFRVNTRKSYCVPLLHCFREACGGEYLDGYDITPLRVSRNRSRCLWNLSRPESLNRMLTDCNNAFDHGMMYLRKVAYRRLKRTSFLVPFSQKEDSWVSQVDDVTRFLPFTESGALGIKTYPGCATNFHLAIANNPAKNKPDYGYTRYVMVGVGKRSDHKKDVNDILTNRAQWEMHQRKLKIGDVTLREFLLEHDADPPENPVHPFWEERSLLICNERPTFGSQIAYFQFIKRELHG